MIIYHDISWYFIQFPQIPHNFCNLIISATETPTAVLFPVHLKLHVLRRAEHPELLQRQVTKGARDLQDAVDAAVLHRAARPFAENRWFHEELDECGC